MKKGTFIILAIVCFFPALIVDINLRKMLPNYLFLLLTRTGMAKMYLQVGSVDLVTAKD